MSRTALITGVSSGIGHAIADRLMRKGDNVIGIARHASRSGFNTDRFHAIDLDLSVLEDLDTRLQTIVNQFADIDTAVLCAGIGRFGSLEEFSYTQIRSIIDLNFTSQAFIARAIVKNLKQRKKGDLIFIGSEAALKGSRKGSVYCASKFAIRGFTQALREECAKSGVRVTLINPGMVRTGFFDELAFTHGDTESNAIEPDDIAQLVCQILMTRKGTIVDEINLSPANRVIKTTPHNPED